MFLSLNKLNCLKSGEKNMKKIIASLILLWCASVNAAFLTFDDAPGGSIQDGHSALVNQKGFNFSSTLHWIDVVGSRWNYGAHSGEFALLNNDSGIGTITEETGGDFTFDGLWVKRWYTAPESGGNYLSGLLSGYNDGHLVWSINTDINGSYQYIGAQSGKIDELVLGFGNNFIVDDLSLTAISNPMSLLLFGFGMFGFVTIRRTSIDC